jgi:hypothetical protein
MSRLAAATVVIFLALVGAASASQTVWFDESEPIPQGQTLTVGSHGIITLNLRHRGTLTVNKVICLARGATSFRNLATEGVGEIRSLTFEACLGEECDEPAVTASGLPWHFNLFGVEHPLSSELKGVALQVRCAGTSQGVFQGTVIPAVGDPDEQCNGVGDELDSEIRFVANKEFPNMLEGPEGSTVKLLGIYHLGGVTGEVFPCMSKWGPESK